MADAPDDILRDAARYRALRGGHGYTPEEEHVRGGGELDDLADKLLIFGALWVAFGGKIDDDWGWVTPEQWAKYNP